VVASDPRGQNHQAGEVKHRHAAQHELRCGGLALPEQEADRQPEREKQNRAAHARDEPEEEASEKIIPNRATPERPAQKQEEAQQHEDEQNLDRCTQLGDHHARVKQKQRRRKQIDTTAARNASRQRGDHECRQRGQNQICDPHDEQAVTAERADCSKEQRIAGLAQQSRRAVCGEAVSVSLQQMLREPIVEITSIDAVTCGHGGFEMRQNQYGKRELESCHGEDDVQKQTPIGVMRACLKHQPTPRSANEITLVAAICWLGGNVASFAHCLLSKRSVIVNSLDGKPAVRRGRKASGPVTTAYGIAGLPARTRLRSWSRCRTPLAGSSLRRALRLASKPRFVLLMRRSGDS
jgi:hypothetical protein